MPLGAQVADELAKDIVRQSLAPGDHLPAEADLAQRFGVSVRVIRDALRTLSNQGIIETRQGKRATVSQFRPHAIEAFFKFAAGEDAAAIAELFDVRIALETRAAGLAAQHATEQDLDRIRAASAAMADRTDDVAEYADADLRWHGALVDAAGNRFFSAIHAALAGVLRAERTTGARMRARAGASVDPTLSDHGRILGAIEARDSEAAEQAMLEHLLRARRVFGAYLAEDGPAR